MYRGGGGHGGRGLAMTKQASFYNLEGKSLPDSIYDHYTKDLLNASNSGKWGEAYGSYTFPTTYGSGGGIMGYTMDFRTLYDPDFSMLHRN